MKVRELIEELQKFDPETEVHMMVADENDALCADFCDNVDEGFLDTKNCLRFIQEVNEYPIWRKAVILN